IPLKAFYSGMGFSISGAILIEKLRSVYTAYQQMGLPIILSGGVGLSVIFISLATGFMTLFFNFIFVPVSAFSLTHFFTMFVFATFIVVMIYLLYKELVSLSLDEEHASVSGIHAQRIHLLIIMLTALIIAASIRIVGVLLVSALMTLPVASAMRVSNSFK